MNLSPDTVEQVLWLGLILIGATIGLGVGLWWFNWREKDVIDE